MEYFRKIKKVVFEGIGSDHPLAFRWYDENKMVAGKSMKDHLRFACSYWHSFNHTGNDPFGESTLEFPWNGEKDQVSEAKYKMDAAFEFMSKMSIPFYCFHDADLIKLTNDISDNAERLLTIGAYAKQQQKETGIRLLWGTANLFSHKRYMNGAATNPDFAVLAQAGAQVKAAIDLTIFLDGENYVFWGGREGYMSLLNTNTKKEKDHLGMFLRKARDYARIQGFKGNFFIEPKPCEPTKHQYDYDAETVIGFLRQYDLLDDFKLNIEVNHATLAGHSFQHEIQMAADAAMLGSIDANRGDQQNGWDTDQFPNNLHELTEAMLVILEAGGFSGGGINFDAKLRRNSTDPIDLFYAHIGGMDSFAQALVTADRILQNSDYRAFRQERYRSFGEGVGKDFQNGKLGLAELKAFALANGEPEIRSGRQEWIENLVNRHI